MSEEQITVSIASAYKLTELQRSGDYMLDVLSRAKDFVYISTAIGAGELVNEINRAIDAYVFASNNFGE